MNRRLLAAAAAVLLAVIGTVLLLGYVSGAEQRAMAGMDPATVLVVAEPVPEGTPAEALGELVAADTLPAAAVGPGAVASLADLTGLVAAIDLVPGEQLLTHRFVDPATLTEPDVIEAPEGMHLVSVLLDPSRVLGGNLTAGARVGVFVSLEGRTHLTLHKVTVTKVQGGIAPPPEPVPAEGAAASPPAPTAEPLPASSVMVTLAVDPGDAERVVYAAEHGSIWLSLEDDAAPEDGTRIVTPENIYE